MKKLSILLSILFFSLPGPALAQKGGVEVSPAIIDVSLTQPEEEQQIELTLTNHEASQISLTLFPIDFKQKDEYGGISFLGEDAGTYSYSLSSFLTLETQSVVLGAKEAQKVIISVKNRQDLSPGGHYAAVVARVTQIDETPTVSPAVSALILLRKTGGERYHLSLKESAWPENLVLFQYPRSFLLLFQNEGNVHLTPYGEVRVKDVFGRLVYKGVLNTASSKVFPESRRYITAELKPVALSLPLSLNTVEIKGHDSLDKTNFVYSESFVYVNPGVLVFVGVLIGLWAIRKVRNLKSRKARE